MARIKHAPIRPEFDKLYADGKAAGEDKDCAVKAVAIAADVTYDEARAALAAAGRKEGQGTYFHMTIAAMRALGFELKRISSVDIIARYPKPHCRVLKNVTTHHPRRFPGVFDPNKTYVLRTRGHILAVQGGVVMGYTINHSCRVISIHEVVKF